MSIGSRIKELRIKRDLTQEELAKRIGVTKGAIANYENGVSSPKIDIMYKLFDVLDCDANYLHQDDMRTSVYKDTSTPEEFEDIIVKYRELDEEGKDAVKYILEREYKRVSAYRFFDPNQLALDFDNPEVPIPIGEWMERFGNNQPFLNAAHESEGEFTPEERQDDEDMLD